MLPYLIFISIVIFFAVSYFGVDKVKSKLPFINNSKFMNSKKKPIINPSVLTKDQKYNHIMVEREKEMDRILDKIYKRGIKSLSIKEKKFLDEYSK